MEVVKHIQKGEWLNATTAWGMTQYVVETTTNGVNFYNILQWGGREPSSLLKGTMLALL